MLLIDDTLKGMFDLPRVYFTLRGNERSEAVLKLIEGRRESATFKATLNGEGERAHEFRVFESADEVKHLFESGVSPNSAVVLFDIKATKRFSPTTQLRPDNEIPAWAHGAQWGIKIGTSCDELSHQTDCAQQVAANFMRNFKDRLYDGMFPWGRPREKEAPPTVVRVPNYAQAIVERLNQGPDLAGAIADKGFALELPTGSRISWYRVPPDPLRCDMEALNRILNAFRAFEVACHSLAHGNQEIQDILLAGVDIDPDLREIYLKPRQQCFSVRRPDLHFTGTGLFSSENDEMPGGFAECAHMDWAYAVNEQRWKNCFDWLTNQGPLLILVSHQWSECYIPEMRWLADHLQALGYPVRLVTTENLDGLAVQADGVYVAGERMGTIWRQFPIFEARGKLVEVVQAAHAGIVRLVPEFAHFGNKAWYSVFRRFSAHYRAAVDGETFRILDEVLPDSHLVQSARDFPCTVAGMRIDSLYDLQTLPEAHRNLLVLKVVGANTLAARSYGVLMGHGLTAGTWRKWIDERLDWHQPFIVQQRLETGVVQLGVYNTKRQCGEAFSCRVLLRPWVVNNQPVAVSTCAVPSNTLRVHGRVDMAMAPVALD